MGRKKKECQSVEGDGKIGQSQAYNQKYKHGYEFNLCNGF